MEEQDAEDQEPRRGFREFITDLRNMDQLVIVIAAILTFCAFAFFFMPAMGPSITKVFDDITRQQEAEAAKRNAPPPPTPGIVDMTLFPAESKKPEQPAKK